MRHIVTDTLGLVLAVLVTAASLMARRLIKEATPTWRDT